MIGINEAIACAQQAAEFGEFPVGAVVVLDGKVIGKGYNQKETLKDPAAHAEILAIRQAASAHWGLALIRRDVGINARALPNVFRCNNTSTYCTHCLFGKRPALGGVWHCHGFFKS